MLDHRRSYWKTTGMALGSTCLLGTVAAVWLSQRAIIIPGYTWAWREFPVLFWLLTGLVGLLAGFGLAVTSGGLLCLRADSRR